MSNNAAVTAAAVAEMVKGTLIGPDMYITGACTLSRPMPGAIGFMKVEPAEGADLAALSGSVFLVPYPAAVRPAWTGCVIEVKDPRSAFAEVLTNLFSPKPSCKVADTAEVDSTATIGQGVTIGAYCVVGGGAVIGEGTELRHHVVVGPNVKIGQNCLIKSNSVIGEEGFGIVKDANGNNFRLPHIGSVVIGDNVEIGALNTVCSGTIEPTQVADFVKTDDHVHIAHNCMIGANAVLTACTELSGSVVIGPRAWLGPNCSIMNGIEVGENVLIGLGAVVTKSCEPNGVYGGSPARRLRERA